MFTHGFILTKKVLRLRGYARGVTGKKLLSKWLKKGVQKPVFLMRNKMRIMNGELEITNIKNNR